jgi:hypothetical protein
MKRVVLPVAVGQDEDYTPVPWREWLEALKIPDDADAFESVQAELKRRFASHLNIQPPEVAELDDTALVQDRELELPVFRQHAVQVNLYDTPYTTEPAAAWFMSNGTLDLCLGSDGRDFPYIECPSCERIICRQNPRNGWHVHFMRDPEYGEEA